MAESRTNRSEHREGGQALARGERDRSTMHSTEPRGGWLSSPFELMDRMSDEMDRVFDRMFRDFGAPRRSWLSRGERQVQGLWTPRVEAFQKGDQFVVRAELPGLKKDDVQVEVTDEAVTIQGQRREEREEEREGFYHSELEYGHFYRTIPLPDGVIADSAKASFKDGVLEVTMQAAPAGARHGRRLEITESSGEGQQQKK
jgi:HSP20 family protein